MLRRAATPLLLALSLAAPLAAQPAGRGVTLFGRLHDQASRAPLPYLSVLLRRARDSAFVAGRLTDTTGAFTFSALAPGVYLLDARRIGYQPLSRRVVVGALSPYLDLGVLEMAPAPAQLGEVTVTSTADAVAAALDRKTYTVGEAVAQAGGSVLQAMAGLPAVTVGEDGKVRLRGSDQVIVLIDGKQTALTGFGSQAGLANLPASAIERIEIINNPGARYDANGGAGIINLVLRKEEQEGVNGTVGLMGGAGALWPRRANLPGVQPPFRYTPKLNPSVAVNYRRRGTNAHLRGDWLHAPTVNRNEFATRRYGDTTVITQQLLRNRRTDYGTLAGGVDHAFDDRHTLSVSGLFNREKILDDGDNPYFLDGLRDRYRLWQFLEDEVKYTALATGGFTRRFPEPGHALVTTASYSFHREDERYFFTNTLPTFTGRDSFALLSDEHVVDVALDYTRPLRQGRVEAGLKGRYRSIPVNMRFFPGERSPLDTGAGGWATTASASRRPTPRTSTRARPSSSRAGSASRRSSSTTTSTPTTTPTGATATATPSRSPPCASPGSSTRTTSSRSS